MRLNAQHKIGLVLGSGAARGWSLIGILQALDEQGIKPDIVVGCSIGALVGSAYCNDKLAELEIWSSTLDPWKVVRLLDWGMGQGGMVSGEKLFARLEQTLGKILIEDSKIKFAAVATELYTGREHVFTQGLVIDAVRASCAIPGILAPQFIQGHWMIDGAVVNPVPVSVCRAMGATKIIAVDLNDSSLENRAVNPEVVEQNEEREGKTETQPNKFQDLLTDSKSYIEQLLKKLPRTEQHSPSFLAVANGAIDIMQNQITRSRLMADPPDLLIRPRVANIGILEFHRAQEAITLGRESVIRVHHLLDEFINK